MQDHAKNVIPSYGALVFWRFWRNSDGVTGAPNRGGVGSNWRFLTNISLYLRNGASHLRWGGRPCNGYIDSYLGNLSVKEFWKSVYVCRSYYQKSSILLFDSQCSLWGGSVKFIGPILSSCHTFWWLIYRFWDIMSSQLSNGGRPPSSKF